MRPQDIHYSVSSRTWVIERVKPGEVIDDAGSEMPVLDQLVAKRRNLRCHRRWIVCPHDSEYEEAAPPLM